MKDQDDVLKYQIALSLLPGIGSVLAKLLVSYCGGVKEIFKMKNSHFLRIPGIGPDKAGRIRFDEALMKAEAELEFIKRNSVQTFFYLDADYPARLKHCEDAPVILFFKGECNLNSSRVVAIIGTRKYTPYGREITEKLVEGLKQFDIVIVSGLAYGIDIIAHRAAIVNQIPTVAVTAHGLDRIYPSVHSSSVEKMIRNGGMLTEYVSGTNPDRENFPARNRIVAGLCDATVVVETASKGGALITAEIANTYNRDVFAIPGRLNDNFSEGCLNLIKDNKARLITSAEDIAQTMNWDIEDEKRIKQNRKQLNLFVELSIEEKCIVEILSENGSSPIDLLAFKAGLPVSRVSSILLNLEFSGVLRSLPGKVYELL